MKKQIILVVLILFTGAAFSQSIDEGKRMLYYQRYDSAEETLRKVIEKDPDNSEAYYWLTKTLIQANELEEARKLQQQGQQVFASVRKQRDIALYKVSKGEVLLNEGKIQEAKGVFSQVLDETREKDPDILIAIARAYLDAKSTEYQLILDPLPR